MASAGIFSPVAVAANRKQSVTVQTIHVPTPPDSPPIVSPRTIGELISIRARQYPDKSILGYPSQGINYVEYSYSQLELFADSAARRYASQLAVRTSSEEKEQVVAILGPSNLDYFVTTLALSRLGFTVLFLSTRISDAAYVSLAEATDCKRIIIDASFRRAASAIQERVSDMQILEFLTASDYAFPAEDTQAQIEQSLDPKVETTKISWIIHSSGSTGLPKPIYQTHKAALQNYTHNMDMEGFITLPLFHAHGLSSVFRAITSNKKIYMYNASLPLTSQNLLGIMSKTQFEIFYGVPYALKLLSESAEGIDALSKMQVVMFGGSACPDELGNVLVNNGVNLISHYGTTETGQLMTSFRPKGDNAWNYVRVHDKLEPFVRWEERGGNMYELVVLDGWSSKVATNRDDGSYATKDLFEPHPSIAGAWKYAGRLDDTIVLMNGEKAIPIAMEQAVRQHRLIGEALIFGSGKARLGMMIIASQSSAHMSSQELLDAIWPTIEKENKNSPSYAQLSQDMVWVLPAGTTYPATDKGTVIRQAFYRVFKSEIEQVYERLEASATGSLVLSASEMKDFLRAEVLKLLPQEDADKIQFDTDLFSLGVDSLQATRLRGTILKNIQLNSSPVSQNVVFENPSISKLADALINLREKKQTAVKDVTVEMAELVEKYSAFPKHEPRTKTSSTACVVVTGATGSLGAHIVAQLTMQDHVTEICCLVRASSDKVAQRRVVQSMREREVYHDLPLSARRKIFSYASNLGAERLGLPNSVYDELTGKVTSLIHCAWSVNFNKALISFEGDCIAGTRNLIDLCLAAKAPTPASFNFCSSVSTVARSPAGSIVPEGLPESFDCAQGMGYAQSKLVTENIISRAASQTGMSARVLRVGQIIADNAHGIWNDTEAIPLMLQAATTFGALPTLNENPRWLPVDSVARVVLDISMSDSKQVVTNIVNPHSFHWTRDLLPALRESGLQFDEVPQKEWIRRLRASNPDPVANPTFKLVEFFASKYDKEVDMSVEPISLSYATTVTESLSPALSSALKTLDQDLVTKLVNRFLQTSWSKSATTATSTPADAPQKTKLVIVAGPAGVGKSTIALSLSSRLSRSSKYDNPAMIEGDAVHDAVAITKMSHGIPLTELDREIWLARLRIQVLERVRANRLLPFGMMAGSSRPSSPKPETTFSTSASKSSQEAPAPAPASEQATNVIILTCSALRRSHRSSLRNLLGLKDRSIETQFIALQASEETLVARVRGREGHYMKADMVRNQIATVEKVEVEETDVLPVDAEIEGGADAVVDEIVGFLGL